MTSPRWGSGCTAPSEVRGDLSTTYNLHSSLFFAFIYTVQAICIERPYKQSTKRFLGGFTLTWQTLNSCPVNFQSLTRNNKPVACILFTIWDGSERQFKRGPYFIQRAAFFSPSFFAQLLHKIQFQLPLSSQWHFRITELFLRSRFSTTEIYHGILL